MRIAAPAKEHSVRRSRVPPTPPAMTAGAGDRHKVAAALLEGRDSGRSLPVDPYLTRIAGGVATSRTDRMFRHATLVADTVSP